MSLSGIISISGLSGLHKILTHTKNGLIVESLVDGRRRPVYSTQKVSSLEDISIYTDDEDLPLKDVFQKISDKESGKKGPNHKSDIKKLRSYLGDLVSNLDGDRVYDSDVSKLFQWYNLLVEKDLMNFDEEEEKEEDSKSEKKAAPKKKTTKSKPTTKAAGKAKAKPVQNKAMKAPSKAGRSSKKA